MTHCVANILYRLNNHTVSLLYGFSCVAANFSFDEVFYHNESSWMASLRYLLLHYLKGCHYMWEHLNLFVIHRLITSISTYFSLKLRGVWTFWTAGWRLCLSVHVSLAWMKLQRFTSTLLIFEIIAPSKSFDTNTVKESFLRPTSLTGGSVLVAELKPVRSSLVVFLSSFLISFSGSKSRDVVSSVSDPPLSSPLAPVSLFPAELLASGSPLLPPQFGFDEAVMNHCNTCGSWAHDAKQIFFHKHSSGIVSSLCAMPCVVSDIPFV